MSVITAIRISISIPVFFTPVLYNNDYYVDGCITNNFPLKYCNENTTIGLYVRINSSNNIKTIINIIFGCLNIVTDTINNKDIISSKNIIQIDCNTELSQTCETNNDNPIKSECFQGFINFDFTTDFKLKLINLGQIFAKKFVENQPINICKNILNEIIDKIINNII